MSYEDLKTKIRLKTGEKIADVQQAYETLIIVANKALGGKPSGQSDLPKADPRTAPKTVDQVEAILTRAFGG